MSENHPKQIGRYQVQGELGRGGFGRVYRAYDPTVGRPVALKVLTDVSTDMLMRFRNEAKVAGNLRHNSIVTVYEYGTHQDVPFLAMEYLEGEDLHHVIASRRPLTVLEKCNIMSQVADGLQYAHSSGVIHRDMKPANIMVLPDRTVKIMDFGIARLTRTPDATRLTQQGYLVGTLRYMAPEQLASADFDARSDIFAYGVIFYEFLTGRHPFEAPDAQSLMYKLTFEEPAPMAQLAPDVPDSLQQVILRMVRKDRERRYQTLREIRFDIEPIRIELQKARASELLLQARGLFDEQGFEQAQKVLQEALLLDAANSTARALWEKVQQSLQQRNLRPRIEALLSTAEEHLASRRFGEAAQAYESALEMDPRNNSIQGRISEARILLEHSARASHLLAEARREFERQNLTAAYRIISEALQHDPQNPEAGEFLKTIESYAERRQAEQRVDAAVRKAHALLLIAAYDEAIALLSASDQKSPRIRECLDRARTEKTAHERKQKFHREMATATDLLRGKRLDDAAKCLELLEKEFPENRDVADLLAYTRKEQAALERARIVENAATEARACAQRRDFEGAITALDSALKKYPDESGLVRLLGSTMAEMGDWQRQQTVQATIAECQSLASQRRFEEAVETVKTALADHGTEPKLISLAKQLEDEWNRHRRDESVRQVCRRAEQMLVQTQPEAAMEALQAGLTQYPGDAALQKLLARAQNEVLVRENARAAERAAAIEKRCLEARSRAHTGDFDGALALLEDGRRTWPDAKPLDELRRWTLVERDRFVRRARVLQELDEIRRSALQHAGDLTAAELLSLAVSLSSEYSQDQEIQSAAAEPIAILSDIGRARQQLAEGNYSAVLEICQRRLAHYSDHPAFGEFLRDAQQGQRRSWLEEIERRAAAEPDLEERCRIFEHGLGQFPDESTLADELRFTRNKLAFVESIVEEARVRERSGRWDEALEKWKSLFAIHSGYPGLNAEVERVQRARDKVRAETGSQSPPLSVNKVAGGGAPRLGIRGLIAGGAAAAALAGGVVSLSSRRSDEIKVNIASNLTGTAISVGPKSCMTPNCFLALPPGTYVLRANQSGYEPVVRQFTLQTGQRLLKLDLTLNPLRAPAVQQKPDEDRAEEARPVADVPPKPAHLEISGAIPGAQVRVDGQLIGETDSNGALRREVTAGTHAIEVSKEDYTPAHVSEQFRSGGALRLNGRRLAMSKVVKPAPAPAEPKQLDAQEWSQVANSTNPDDFERFIRNHPGTAYVEPARSRASELRQQMRARAAQQLDQAAWEKVDQRSREHLEDYLSRFPVGAHAQEARARIADADRQAAEAAAAQRSREQRDQEQAKLIAEQQAVVKVLREFDDAYNRRDLASLQRMWRALPVTTYRQQFREAKDLKFQLQLIGQPAITGNSATATCTRTLSYRGQSGGPQTRSERVKLTLSKESSGWVIRSIDLN